MPTINNYLLNRSQTRSQTVKNQLIWKLPVNMPGIINLQLNKLMAENKRHEITKDDSKFHCFLETSLIWFIYCSYPSFSIQT